MKNKLSIFAASFAILCLGWQVNYAASVSTATTNHASTYLTIINNWGNTVHVKEGMFLKTDEDLYPGRTISKQMISGSIANLAISYSRNGMWVNIPGCPVGSFNYSVTVFINYAPWDPNFPICNQV